MEIDGIDRAKRGEIKKSGRKDKTSETDEAFLGALDQAEKKEKRQELDDVMKEVEEQGRQLLKNFKPEEVKKYRETVGRFLSAALGESFKLTETHSISKKGKYSAHLNLEKVESGLDKLTQMVVEGQAESLKLLEKIDEIKGLLFDIYK